MYIAIYLQGARGQSVLASGYGLIALVRRVLRAVLTVQGLAHQLTLLASALWLYLCAHCPVICADAASRQRSRGLLIASFAISMAGFGGLAALTPHSPTAAWVLASIVAGIGCGLSVLPAWFGALGALPPSLAAECTTLMVRRP